MLDGGKPAPEARPSLLAAPVLVFGFAGFAAVSGLATVFGASVPRTVPQGSVGPLSGMLPRDFL
jgi:hypothetical protein